MKVLFWSVIFVTFLSLSYQFIGKENDAERPRSVRQETKWPGRSSDLRLDISDRATLKPRQLDRQTRTRVEQIVETTPDFDPWQEYLDRLSKVDPYLAKLADDRPEKIRTMRDMRELLQMELDKAWHGDRQISILVLGHSVLGWFPPQIWPPDTFNRALAGNTFANIDDRLSELRDFEVDTIVLMAGIAELMEGDSLASIAIDYNRLLDKIAASHPNATVIVLPTLPIGTRSEIEAGGKDFEDLLDVSNIEIEGLNQSLYRATLKNDRAINVVFLGQIYDYFINDRGYAKYDRDGLHLSHEGAAILGTFVEEAVRVNSTFDWPSARRFQYPKRWDK